MLNPSKRELLQSIGAASVISGAVFTGSVSASDTPCDDPDDGPVRYCQAQNGSDFSWINTLDNETYYTDHGSTVSIRDYQTMDGLDHWSFITDFCGSAVCREGPSTFYDEARYVNRGAMEVERLSGSGDIVSPDTDSYVGSMNALSGGDGLTLDDIGAETFQFLIEEANLIGTLYSAGDSISNLYNIYDESDHSYNSVEREFDWLDSEFDDDDDVGPFGCKQANYWTKYDFQLDPSDVMEVRFRDYAGMNNAGPTNMNVITATVEAPPIEPSISVDELDSETVEKYNIEKYDAEEYLKNNALTKELEEFVRKERSNAETPFDLPPVVTADPIVSITSESKILE